MKKKGQRTCTSLYDIDIGNSYSIVYEEIHFVKAGRYGLTVNSDHSDGTSTDHEYFCIHDDLFNIILETDQNSNSIVKVIHKEQSF